MAGGAPTTLSAGKRLSDRTASSERQHAANAVGHAVQRAGAGKRRARGSGRREGRRERVQLGGSGEEMGQSINQSLRRNIKKWCIARIRIPETRSKSRKKKINAQPNDRQLIQAVGIITYTRRILPIYLLRTQNVILDRELNVVRVWTPHMRIYERWYLQSKTKCDTKFEQIVTKIVFLTISPDRHSSKKKKTTLCASVYTYIYIIMVLLLYMYPAT